VLSLLALAVWLAVSVAFGAEKVVIGIGNSRVVCGVDARTESGPRFDSAQADGAMGRWLHDGRQRRAP
jgi:hypothetical protein